MIIIHTIFRNSFLPIVLSLGVVSACSAKPEHSPVTGADAVKQTVRAAVSRLYSPGHSKVYPNDQLHLDRCVAQKETACLASYEEVKKAKNSITSIPQKDALPAVLELIPELCLSDDEWQANAVCYAAIRSLYLFNSTDQDQVILGVVKSYPKAVRSIVFNAYLDWLHNRSDKALWVNYLSVADIDWGRRSKDSVIDAINTPLDTPPLWASH